MNEVNRHETVQITLHLPTEQAEAIDALVKSRNARAPGGAKYNRQTVIRHMIDVGLRAAGVGR